MVETDFLKEYYCGNINQLKEWILLAGEWIRVCSCIREMYPRNRMIVELCREVLFDKEREIKGYVNDIEKIRASVKKLS